ncbi:MAG: VOC family protein [Rhodospirillales bacterium]|nr:VOC family protein [Rhodospirillales bacterium]
MRRGIDHLVLCVNDLDAARQAYGRLGFTTTPPALHPFGTGNSLVQLQGNFLELLSVAEPGKIPPTAPGQFSFGAFNRDFLARRQGMSMLVFQSDDARRDQREFAANDLETYAPFDFSRRATLPDGSAVTVAFSLAFVTDPRMPEAAFFVCQQHAPEYFWKPDYQRHPNGAIAVSEVVMVADDPAAFAGFFQKLQGPESVTAAEGVLQVATALGRVTLLDRRRFAARFPDMPVPRAPDTPHFAGYRVTVADLARTEALLRQAALPVRREAGSLRIAPADAFGVVLEFAEKGV